MSNPAFLLSLPVTAVQFAILKSQLEAQHATVVFDTQSSSSINESGEISTSDVDLTFNYSGDVLAINLVKANSFLARHVSNAIVAAHVHDLIFKALNRTSQL
jgi:hypothetical protein